MLIFGVFDINLPQNSKFNTSTNKKPSLCINEKSIAGFTNEFNSQFTESFDLVNYSAKDSFHDFLNFFKELYDKWFLHENPAQCKNIHTKSDWITPALAKSSQTKNLLYQYWRKHRSAENWNTYIDYERNLDKLTNKVKYDYYNKKFFKNCKNNTKKVWQIINQFLGRKKRNSALTFQTDEASHNFKTYFTLVAHKLVSKTYPSYSNCDDGFRNYLKHESTPLNSYIHTNFEIDYLTLFIAGLNDSKSTYFAPKVLKRLSDFISPLLIKLFNKCHNEGYFPSDIKNRKGYTIFQK